MDVCNLINDLYTFGPSSAAQDSISTFIGDLMDSWGFGSVNVEFGDLDFGEGGVPGQYDPSTNTITIDEHYIEQALNSEKLRGTYEDGPYRITYVAIHEAMHALADLAGVDFGGEGFLGIDFGGELEHDWIRNVGVDILDEALERCYGIGAESGAGQNLPRLPFSTIPANR